MPLCVTVVSNHQDTLRGLETYLRGAGVIANSITAMDRLVEMTPATSTAVILFPDEYGQGEVRTALAALSRERNEVLAVIVTNDPRRFEQSSGGRLGGVNALVIPKPAWAWTILDAVRARLEANAPPAAT